MSEIDPFESQVKTKIDPFELPTWSESEITERFRKVKVSKRLRCYEKLNKKIAIWIGDMNQLESKDQSQYRTYYLTELASDLNNIGSDDLVKMLKTNTYFKILTKDFNEFIVKLKKKNSVFFFSIFLSSLRFISILKEIMF
jgi:hypothetical protein